jgi:hypothetical protein
VGGSDFEGSGAFLRGAGGDDHLQAEDFSEQDGGGADAAGAAMDKDPVPCPCPAEAEEVVPDGEEGFRQRRALDHRQGAGDRQALAFRGGAKARIAAAGDEGTDACPDQPRVHALARRDDQAGNLESGDGRSAGRGRIDADPLHDVGTVHARRSDPDQNLARFGNGHRPLDRDQHLGSAGTLRIDGEHGFGDRGVGAGVGGMIEAHGATLAAKYRRRNPLGSKPGPHS